MNKIDRIFIQGLMVVGLFYLSSCRSSCKLTSIESDRIEMTSAWDNPDTKTAKTLIHYRDKVDSIMAPVLGISAMDMLAKRPESPLSNLIADMLRDAVEPYIGKPADLALMNVGGIRNSLKTGEITYGDIFEMLPFDNTVCILTLKGKYVKELMQNIVMAGGEGTSNINIRATKDREVIDATVGGEAIDNERLYKIATIDYLAEGNDKMAALLKAEEKACFADKTIREVFVEYVKAQTAAGKELTAKIEGRITIE